MSKPIKNLQLFNDLCAVEETLIKLGWYQGDSHGPGGSICLVQAITTVTARTPATFLERFCAVERALWSAISTGEPVHVFNDNPATTFGDVLAKLKIAREALCH
jgi:hypothetical protein